MRTGRGRTQIQFGKTEVWNGAGNSEAGRNGCACGCPVHSAAESAKDSVRFFAISGLDPRFPATMRKVDGYSVDINYIVTDASYVIPTDYTSMGHAFIERHLHTCSCGDQFYETHAKVYRPHVYSSKDAKFAYTTIGGNGETLYVYRFNCTQCNYTTLKTFTAPIS